MSATQPITQEPSSIQVSLDPRLVQWMAVQVQQDRYARLLEGGADADAQKIELASIFVDLPLDAPRRMHRPPSEPGLAMAHLLDMLRATESFLPNRFPSESICPRILLLGGPGSGKSTLTTMVAQVLRVGWINRQVDALPPDLKEAWQRACEPLESLIEASKWTYAADILPIRVHLPMLTRWLGSRSDKMPRSLWDYLAARVANDLESEGITCDIGPSDVRGWIKGAGKIYWILDGLDEVPHTAGRKQVIDTVRAATKNADGMLVATRPQGYGREFNELDEHELTPLPKDVAYGYAERLMRAWAGRKTSSSLTERLENLRNEFEKPSVAALLYSPLHTTIAALLIANQGTLPKSRSLLFEDYFKTILRRELNKQMDHGIRREDEDVIRALHARAGLTLHVRSQEGASARPTLRRRELCELLTALYTEQRYSETDTRANVERIMRFAVDRLVLLLHSSEGEFEFGVRSLQEFFAAEALAEDDVPVVEKRLEAIATNPHWLNVITLMASRCASSADKRVKRLADVLVALCRRLNDGTIGGEAAKRCFVGSLLAISILDETQEYGSPALHDPLWDIALEAAASRSRDSIEYLGLSWAGPNLAERRKSILRAAERLLSAGRESRLDGWRLLAWMLRANMDEAIALADQYAPTTPEEAQEMAQILCEDRSDVPKWVARYIERNICWFSPHENWTFCSVESPPVLFSYSDLLVSPRFNERASICISLANNNHRWWIQSIDCSPKWQALADRTPEISPMWRMWKCVASFIACPSHTQLADVLDAVNGDALMESLGHWTSDLPWPISACLDHVNNYVDLPALANRIRIGELGTVDDWRAAEIRWKNSPMVSLGDVESSRGRASPWGNDIATHGTIFISSTFTGSDEIPLALARIGMRGRGLDETSHFRSPFLLAPALSGPDGEEWFTLLDSQGRTGVNTLWYDEYDADWKSERAQSNINDLIERIVVRPDQWGLLDPLRALLFVVPNTDLSALHLPELTSDAPPRAKALHVFFALLIADANAAPDASLLGRLIFEENGKIIDLRAFLAEMLVYHTVPRPTTESLLLGALHTNPPPRPNIRDELLNVISIQFRRSIKPSFITREAWHNHALPEPCLSEQPPERPAPRIVRIAELRNIRLFKETPLVEDPFPLPTTDRGQCIVIVGENGAGKTTFLRALALALASPPIASKLLDERLPFLNNGGDGTITIELDTGPLAVTVRRNERTEIIESQSGQETIRPWVVGYGVRRGNARGEKDREPEVGPIGELHTLFDRPASLHNAVIWLKDLDADVLREQRKSPRSKDDPPTAREGIWNAVVNALRMLLGITDLNVDEGGLVFVGHPQFGRVRLDALSDGYLTTAGWIIDMIARWIDRQRELDEHVGADVLQQMTGFVLIDEIDLHLHPVWQMRIIDDVRQLFPRLSFVVTTHNPLTLQGARRGEVYVMRRAEDGRIELVQKDIRPGQDVDRVLFEQFGVAHTFDRDTRTKLARHADMISRGVSREDPDRIKIEAELNARLGNVGNTLTKERDAAAGPVAPLNDEERAELLADMQVFADEKN